MFYWVRENTLNFGVNMIPFLGLAKLFSNPITKYVGQKVIGHFEHKAEVLKNERGSNRS